VDEAEWSGTSGKAEQVFTMALGTKAFLVAALMAVVALSGSIGTADAQAGNIEHTLAHIAH